ncbi:MAG: putative Ig domain-containing protein [Steroidobacteraceae bacterium]|jgi:hypothetical protein
MKGTGQWVAPLVCSVLAACGGGGGGGSGGTSGGSRATEAGPSTAGNPATPGNSPPSITGQPANTAPPDADYYFRPQAVDADGDALRFAVTNLPAWARFDAATGTITGRPTASDRGSHGPVGLSVSDGRDSVALAPFRIEVPDATAANPAGKRSLTLSWEPPTQNDDGTPAPPGLRYRVHIGLAPRSYSDSILLPAEATRRVEIPAPGTGTYYLAITSLTPEGVEGPFSDEVSARLN